MINNRCKVNVLAALSSLFMARGRLLCSTCSKEQCVHQRQILSHTGKLKLLKR